MAVVVVSQRHRHLRPNRRNVVPGVGASRLGGSPGGPAGGPRAGESGIVTTEFVMLYGVLLALVMSVIHFGLVFNAALAVADAADTVLEAVQVEAGSVDSVSALARAVVGDDRLVRDLSVDVDMRPGEVAVVVSAASPRIVPGLPTAVSRRVEGPVERFIPEGRR